LTNLLNAEEAGISDANTRGAAEEQGIRIL
jgi:hypothetical protein